MLYSRQYFVADKITVVTFFITKLFGLWPYKFQHSDRHIEYDFFSIIYSVFAPILILFAYVYVGSYLFTESIKSIDRSSIFTSLPLQLIVMVYSYLIIISYLTLYVGQHLNSKRKVNAYVKCKKIADCMRQFRTEYVDIKDFLSKYLLKTIVYEILNFSLFYHNFVSSSSEVVNSRSYLLMFIYLPTFTVRLNTNIFFGGVLFFHVLYKQLNRKLKSVFSRLKVAHNVREDVFPISVEFEKASFLYFELATAMRAFTSVFSFQITLWITTQLIILTTQYFYQYVAITQLTRGNYFVWTNLTMLSSIFMSMYDLITTALECNSLVKEVSIVKFCVYILMGVKLSILD